MGLKKIRTKLQVDGDITVGDQIESATLNSPTLSAPTFSGAGAGTLNMVAGELRTGTILAALTNTNVGTAKPGRIVIGNNGATIQLGFVHNGTVFIFGALAGTGAVTSAVGA